MLIESPADSPGTMYMLRAVLLMTWNVVGVSPSLTPVVPTKSFR